MAPASSSRRPGVIVLYSSARVRTIDRTPASVSVRRVLGMRARLASIHGSSRGPQDVAHPRARARDRLLRPGCWGALSRHRAARAHALLRAARRGDGARAGRGRDRHLLQLPPGAVPASILQSSRAWPDDDWGAGTERVRARGWLDDDGRLTDTGRDHREHVERRTDELALAPWLAIGEDACDRLRAVVRPLSKA